MMHRKLSFLVSLALVSCFLMMVGCSNDRITAAKIRRNTTPELDHVAASNEQIRNDHARIIDNNTRGIWSDLDRLLLTNRNSRLQPHSMP